MTDAPAPRLVYYPGHHGAETKTTMRNPTRAMAWKAGQVRQVPEPEATDYIRLGGYLEALTVAAAAERFGLEEAAVERLVARGAVTTARTERDRFIDDDLDLKKRDLVLLAVSRGLDTGGTKADLVARLEARREGEIVLVLDPTTARRLRKVAAAAATDPN